MITDDPALKAMREIDPLSYPCPKISARRWLVVNLQRGSEMATLGEIAANAAPVAHRWGALAAAQDHELGHA